MMAKTAPFDNYLAEYEHWFDVNYFVFLSELEAIRKVVPVRSRGVEVGIGSGIVTEKHLAFYKRRSQYLGVLIPEPFYIGKGLREIPTQMGIDEDDKIVGLKKLTAEMSMLKETENIFPLKILTLLSFLQV